MYEILIKIVPLFLILLIIIGFTIISRINRVLENQEKIMLDLNKLQVSLDEESHNKGNF